MCVVVQVTAYLQSLNGILYKKTVASKFQVCKDFIGKVQTMHLIQVLCPDSKLTKHNFLDMMRCDCKGYWKLRACKCVYALAHW